MLPKTVLSRVLLLCLSSGKLVAQHLQHKTKRTAHSATVELANPTAVGVRRISPDPLQWQRLIGAAAALVGSFSSLDSVSDAALMNRDGLSRVYELQDTFERCVVAIPRPVDRQFQLQPRCSRTSTAAAPVVAEDRLLTQPEMSEERIPWSDAAIFAAHVRSIPRELLPGPPNVQAEKVDTSIPGGAAGLLKQHPEKCAKIIELLTHLTTGGVPSKRFIMTLLAKDLWNVPVKELDQHYQVLLHGYACASILNTMTPAAREHMRNSLLAKVYGYAYWLQTAADASSLPNTANADQQFG